MLILFSISAMLVIVALVLLVGCLRCLGRGRLVAASSRLVGTAATAGLGGIGVMFGTSYLGYERLTEETPVGQIEFVATGPQTFDVRLMRSDKTDRLFELAGDEWQLDARVIRWTPPATILGLDPVYELERISGRYADLDQERTGTRTVFALADRGRVDLWSFAREHPKLLPGVDAYYGTATYLPMADGARYTVSMSRDALIARPANEQAQKAVGEWRAR
jgi:hypothetical protein